MGRSCIVPEEKTAEVIRIYEQRSRKVDKAQGFGRFLLLQNEIRPGELSVHMERESKEHYLRWVTSEEFKQIHELEKKHPDQEPAAIIPQIGKFKVVAT
ncbi:antibiotic biosynthesis monooxygenase [Paenibacillus athensensis]|uniref:Antibiotic biosynthesis monooxygenase n=1 Tax=Paenibacillus athensensis TaxID=1967502 RepID=A0A4Y8Q182_9BACL|nr:antibiotic biosynthesis monooxygenase [Paenibacillus athensensis]MCD1260629.1 antibiotic biosynthesis monooxygenase [Paenibacillus athensensis]